MIESNINTVTALSSNADSVAFANDSIRTPDSTCCGWLNHEEGSANYDILNGGVYSASVKILASSAAAGVVAFQLYKNGEPIPGTLMAESLSAAGDFATMSVKTNIKVCCRGDANISLRAVPAVPTPTDPVTPITTQVPIIINANIVLDRVLESAPRRTPIWMNV